MLTCYTERYLVSIFGQLEGTYVSVHRNRLDSTIVCNHSTSASKSTKKMSFFSKQRKPLLFWDYISKINEIKTTMLGIMKV